MHTESQLMNLWQWVAPVLACDSVLSSWDTILSRSFLWSSQTVSHSVSQLSELNELAYTGWTVNVAEERGNYEVTSSKSWLRTPESGPSLIVLRCMTNSRRPS